MAGSSAARKPVYLRGIPADVIREAKALAARRGVTLAGFVTEVLTRAVEEQAAPPDLRGSFQKELRWFEQQRARLSREHPGEYVAIVGDELVDHDPAFELLAERVFARFGARNVFMPRVSAAPQVVRVRSPRLKQR